MKQYVLNIMSVSLFCLIYPTCNAHVFDAAVYCHVWPVWLYHIFPHYLIKGTIFVKLLLNKKCVFLFSIQLLCETFLILRRIQRDSINVHRCSCKVPVLLMKLEFSRQIFVKSWNIKFRENPLSGSRDVSWASQTDSRLSQFCQRA